jgi:hypothetical protein
MPRGGGRRDAMNLEERLRAETIPKAIHAISAKSSYPINSFEDLEKALGNKQLMVGGKSITFGDLRGVVPANYFPIADKQNFREKAVALFGEPSFQAYVKQVLGPETKLAKPLAPLYYAIYGGKEDVRSPGKRKG